MSRPLPLRRVRKSSRPTIAVSLTAWALSDGTAGLTADDVAPDPAAARKAWPRYRRDVWAHTFVGHLPAAAEAHDGLTTHGFDVLWETCRAETFDLDAVLAALDVDRAAVRAFEQRDPTGARDIADYLAAFVGRFDLIDSEARRFAAAADRWALGMPRVSTGTRYAELADRSDER
jgi:hypothetical protein